MIALTPPSRRARLGKAIHALVPRLPLVLTAGISVVGGLLVRSASVGQHRNIAVPAAITLLLAALCVVHLASDYFARARDVGRGEYVRTLAEIASSCAANEDRFELHTLSDFIEAIEDPVTAGTVIDVLTHDIGAYDAIPRAQQKLAENMVRGVTFRYYIPDHPAVEDSLCRHLAQTVALAVATHGRTYQDAVQLVKSRVEIYTVAAPALYYFALQSPSGGGQPIGLWYLTCATHDKGRRIVYIRLNDVNRDKLRDVFYSMQREGLKRSIFDLPS